MSYALRSGAIRKTKNQIISLSTAAVVAVASLSGVVPLFLNQQALAAVTADPIRGNTSAGENQPGWAFNRDTTTSSPYEFTDADSSIGDGSLYVMPIGTTPSDKFVAENFIVGTALADVESISFEYKLGNGVTSSNAKHFYLNVYANYAESTTTKFYDCRYNIVAQTGSSSDFTPLTFNTNSPINGFSSVTKSSSSPRSTCPTTPADMGQGATIRAYAISVGDTSANDAGIHGYIDNVRLTKTTGVTAYDFEPTPIATIDDTNYYSLASALAAATQGSTIELLGDVDLSGTYLNVATDGITIDGNGHTITTSNSWVAGPTGNGTTDYAIQLNANDVTIKNLVIAGTASSSPAGGINVFNRTGVVLQDITSQNNATAVAVVGSNVTIDGLTSSDSTWGFAVNVDRGSASQNGLLTITGANSWNEPHFIYIDNVAKGSVLDVDGQYKKVTLPHPTTPNITSAVYTSPDASVDVNLPVSVPLPSSVTIESPAGSVNIPANTVISGQGWNGVLSAPNTVTAPTIEVPGYTVSNVVAVSVGSSTMRLNFSAPVKVTLPGQAGKLAGFVDHTNTFHAITTPCGASVATTLAGSVEECWTVEANDLVIWTTHFTTFVAYNATAQPVPAGQPTTNKNTNNSAERTFTVSSSARNPRVAYETAGTTTSIASILGANTQNDTSSANTTAEQPVVENEAEAENSNRFLGLGWWWILVLTGVGLLAYYWFVVRKADQQ